MEPRSFMDNKSKAYQDAVNAIKTLIMEQGIDVTERAFAEVIWEPRKRLFLNNHEPGDETPDGHVCLSRLLGEECPEEVGGECDSPYGIPGSDHLSEWSKDGTTKFIVSQPYEIGHAAMTQISRMCKTHGLTAYIRADSSWHFPSHSLMLIWEKQR